MPYPQYDGPDKPDRGQEGGSCNRSRCQDTPADWYNHGSHAWYCARCRRDIQFDSFNLRDWEQNWQPRKGHPMFETRAQMDARLGAASPTGRLPSQPVMQNVPVRTEEGRRVREACVGSLDDGVPNRFDPSKRGFQP